MLLSLLTGGSIREIIVNLILYLPVLFLALSIHEAAHGYAAWKCGDPTARNLGRLTLNPLKHLDLVGTLCMAVFGFGWAKPVPINTRYFRKPKRDTVITAAAGPLSNLLVGAIFAVLYGAFFALWYFFGVKGNPGLWYNVFYWASTLSWFGALVNFTFAFFNLIPIPPFDGSRIFLSFLPTKAYFKVMRYERQIMLGILIALFVSSYFFDFSPTAWLAEEITLLIANPVCELLLNYVLFP